MRHRRAPQTPRSLTPLLASVACLVCLGLGLFVAPTPARADFYDLAEDRLEYAYPSVRRVIGMYSLRDSPSFLGGSLSDPYIQLDLTFAASDAEAPPFTKSEGVDPGAVNPPAAPAAPAAPETPAAPAAPVEPAAPATPNAEGKSPAAGETSAPEQPQQPQQVRRLAPRLQSLTPQDEGASLAESAAPSSSTPPAAPATAGAKADAPARIATPSQWPQVQAVILQAMSLDSLGHWDPQSGTLVDYCCTSALFESGVDGCNRVGTLIVRSGTVHRAMGASFADGSKVARLAGEEGRYNVTTTGEHILILSNCDGRLSEQSIRVSGRGVWRNPYGYLPGRLFGFLPFYFAMFLLYLSLAFLWSLLNCLHLKHVAGIQHFLSVALLLTLVEVMAWFVDYQRFNVSGVRGMGGVIAAIVVSVLRLTVSRTLVVAVSIGYPVVRPSLATSTKVKIVVLGSVYFICETALEVVTRYAQTSDVAERWRIFLSLPVALLNAIFYWWIFTALHDLLAFLTQQNQAIKLAMYKTFTHVLAGSLIAAVGFALYQIYFMATNQLALHWSQLWLLDGGFQLMLYTVIFIAMAWLWRPSSDSRRYAYAELSHPGGGPESALGSLDDEDEFALGDGELEMTEDGGAPHGVHAHINEQNAKFTVDADDDDQM